MTPKRILSWSMTLLGFLLFAPGAEVLAEADIPLLERIIAKAKEIDAELIGIRRQIHMHPEVSGQEEKTAALVAEKLRGLGLEVETGVGGHGVVGLLRGGKPGPVVAYRADMDAVLSAVLGDVPYKSRVAGVKHVCGHDAHVAVGLGVAEVLTAVREDLPGTVKFIFQPAEENVQGAKAMIEAGVLENPAPEVIFAAHTGPWQVGHIVCPLGVGVTGWDTFEARIEDGTKEIVQEALRAVVGVSTVAPLMSPEQFKPLFNDLLVEDGPYEDFIFIQLGGPFGSADRSAEGILAGMVRAAGPASYDRARKQIREALEKVTAGRAGFELTFGDTRFPDMHSDRKLVEAAIAPIEAAIGKGKTIMMRASAPYFGEDFALYQQKIPGALFFLGVANEEKGIAAFNHSPDYDIDERAIGIGTVAMASVLLDYLENH